MTYVAPHCCKWEEDCDGMWSSICGQQWCFEDGGNPSEHGCKFCHHCGGNLTQLSYIDPIEDEVDEDDDSPDQTGTPQ